MNRPSLRPTCCLEMLEQRLCLTQITLNDFASDRVLNVTVDYTISDGPAAAFQIGLYASDDTVFDVGDTLIGGLVDAPDLATGSHELGVNLTELSDAIVDLAIPFILAVADPENTVAETNEDDNSDYFVGVGLSGETVGMRGSDSTTHGDVFAFARAGVGSRLHFNGERVTISSPVSVIRALGNAGRDEMRSTASYDVELQLRGGPGNDVLIGGSGDDLIDGGAGGDVINGYRGDDLISGDGLAFDSGSRDIIYGHEGDDTIEGGVGNDRIVGMNGADILLGGDGDDALIGRDGNDTLFGNNGNDILLGGRNNDRLSGDADNDRLYGVGGNDTLIGGMGADLLRGGFDNDTLNGASVFLEDMARDNILGEQGTDTVEGLRDPLDRVVARQIESDIRVTESPRPGPSPWQNPVDRFDINDDGVLTHEDLEPIAIRFYLQIPLSYPPNFLDNPPPYYDVNGDNYLSSDDIDELIAELRTMQIDPELIELFLSYL